MKTIQLPSGQAVIVDDQDFEWLSRTKWSALKKKNGRYYAHNSRIGLMHRLILGLTLPNVFCDHRDNNGLNNQRGNLRIARGGQNHCNRPKQANNTSGFKGVSRHKEVWRAKIIMNGKQHHLGLFKEPEAAAKAYDRAAIEMHGEFCNLNFPQQNKVQ